MSGDPLLAIAHWHHAVVLCARTSDTQSLRPILERLLTLEKEGVAGPHIQELESYLDLLGALSRK